MFISRRISRCVAIVASCVLLLNAAMPFLARAAAAAQGVAVGDVCDVYGVTLTQAPMSMPMTMEHARHHHHEHHASAHAPGAGTGTPAGDHDGHGLAHKASQCAISAIGTFALISPELLPQVGVRAAASAYRKPGHGRGAIADAPALWRSRLEHAPPSNA